MTHTPTPEQAAVVDGFLTGQNLVIEAGAGTGKTSTLKLLAAQATGRRGIYIAYNRAIADDAARGFPSSVLCKTAHGLAYGAVGTRYRHRLNAPRQRAADTARILRINDPVRLADDKAPFAPQQLARLAMETVQRFCYSADERIHRYHVPLVNGVDTEPERAELARYLVPIAQRAWDEDLTQVDGKLRFTHDTYLKLWILAGPQLPADYVLLDEAQDSNPAVAALVAGQNAQQILVGDRSQAIYGWRGAVDAMAKFVGQRYQLSQSFRFGPAIADEANKWLTVLAAPLRLSGYDQIPSTVGPAADPDAILCRSNAGAMARVIEAAEKGRAVALVGGGGDIQRMARAALDLQAGRPTDHPELFPFTSWREVEEYVSQGTDGSDLKVFVGLVNRYGAAEVIQACDGLVDEKYADLVISTAHKAKGREWETVRIATDFPEPKPDDEGEVRVPREDAMLAYVAVTRAQLVLDREGLEWVDQLVPAGYDYQPDPLTRARAVAAIAPEYVRPAALDPGPGDEEWPAPVEPDEDDEEAPGGPAPTVEPDLVEALYERIIEPAPGGGWLAVHCLRCGDPWRDCECALPPDRRWTTTGSIVDFARLIHARRDALRLAGAR
jgi:AAA domain/UvrD-like helicase C-terminal domain